MGGGSWVKFPENDYLMVKPKIGYRQCDVSLRHWYELGRAFAPGSDFLHNTLSELPYKSFSVPVVLDHSAQYPLSDPLSAT